MCASCDRLRAELREVKEELEEWRLRGEKEVDDRAALIQTALSATPQVSRVIDAMMDNPGRLIESHTLVDVLHYNGRGGDLPKYGTTDEGRLLKVIIFHARKTLERAGITSPIETIWGRGYSLSRDKAVELRAILEAA